eukprot:4489190-Prymnesium_polylepis.1
MSAAGRPGVDNLEPGAQVCTQAREYSGTNGKAETVQIPACVSAGELASIQEYLVGRPVTVPARSEEGDRAALCDGKIINAVSAAPVINAAGDFQLGGGMRYEALVQTPWGERTVILTPDAGRAAVEMYEMVQLREAEARRKERDAAAARARRAAASAG